MGSFELYCCLRTKFLNSPPQGGGGGGGFSHCSTRLWVSLSFLIGLGPSLLFWGCFHLVEASTEFLTPRISQS